MGTFLVHIDTKLIMKEKNKLPMRDAANAKDAFERAAGSFFAVASAVTMCEPKRRLAAALHFQTHDACLNSCRFVVCRTVRFNVGC